MTLPVNAVTHVKDVNSVTIVTDRGIAKKTHKGFLTLQRRYSAHNTLKSYFNCHAGAFLNGNKTHFEKKNIHVCYSFGLEKFMWGFFLEKLSSKGFKKVWR